MRIDKPPGVTFWRPGAWSQDDECRALMAGYQAGDRSAFERLYESFAPAVITYLDVIDPRLGRDPALLSEVFLAIHRARRSYDPRRSFARWAGAITQHVVLSFYPARRSRRRRVESGNRAHARVR